MNYLLLFLSIVLSVSGQIFQKLGMSRTGPNRQMKVSLLKSILIPYNLIGMVCLGLSAFIWLIVLSKMELSLAYPLLSFGYVLVTISSKLFFKEIIPWNRWVGVLIVVFGIMLVTQA